MPMNSYLMQGFLDEQFIQLEELEDSANPNFVEEIVTLFFKDSVRNINNIEQALERSPLDFDKLDRHMHQFKGSCSSIGAAKVRYESTQFREYCTQGNAEGCIRTFQQLKRETAILQKKFEIYFQHWSSKSGVGGRDLQRVLQKTTYEKVHHNFPDNEDTSSSPARQTQVLFSGCVRVKKPGREIMKAYTWPACAAPSYTRSVPAAQPVQARPKPKSKFKSKPPNPDPPDLNFTISKHHVFKSPADFFPATSAYLEDRKRSKSLKIV
ncbi:hypothetical protein GIB67_027918 [Kingdonia uniflora]|uniref:Histidine-containing phosphotransfer protein n=1 Tax=Kingdonia uniflora TaxID=39325 RepID=A0A7J7LGS7_9MAGN|nr:hypothetical protein GIB67_027918 [Kingdonia uniflora]